MVSYERHCEANAPTRDDAVLEIQELISRKFAPAIEAANAWLTRDCEHLAQACLDHVLDEIKKDETCDGFGDDELADIIETVRDAAAWKV